MADKFILINFAIFFILSNYLLSILISYNDVSKVQNKTFQNQNANQKNNQNYNNQTKIIKYLIFNFILSMQQQTKSILILDANAFISSSKIAQLGKNNRLVTTSDVIAELKDQKTKQYLQRIPFEIQEKDFDEKSLGIVKQFAKKTGDIGSLSDIDMELIALAHTLYVKEGLSQKLRKQPLPIVQQVIQDEQQTIDEHQSQEQDEHKDQQQQAFYDEQGWIKVPVNAKNKEEQDNSDIDEEQGWITPSNYNQKMAEINTAYLETKDQGQSQNVILSEINQLPRSQFSIALISADFAIQNVATHMGIKLIALDGRVISSIRRFIWECYLCWKQFNVNENKVKLCSGCGYNSLSKISYSMDTKGNVILHRKTGWKPNKKVQEWKDKKYEQQQKKKKHQHQRRRKKQSIFDTV